MDSNNAGLGENNVRKREKKSGLRTKIKSFHSGYSD